MGRSSRSSAFMCLLEIQNLGREYLNFGQMSRTLRGRTAYIWQVSVLMGRHMGLLSPQSCSYRKRGAVEKRKGTKYNRCLLFLLRKLRGLKHTRGSPQKSGQWVSDESNLLSWCLLGGRFCFLLKDFQVTVGDKKGHVGSGKFPASSAPGSWPFLPLTVRPCFCTDFGISQPGAKCQTH